MQLSTRAMAMGYESDFVTLVTFLNSEQSEARKRIYNFVAREDRKQSTIWIWSSFFLSIGLVSVVD